MGSVTIDHTKLDAAITKMSTLSSAVERYRSSVLFKSPVDHPKLSALSSVPTWLDGEKPMLQGLRDIAYLLATESNPVATFEVGDSLHDVEQLLGETLAEQARSTSPYDEQGAERFVEILSRWQTDPAVMSEMFGALGPEETLAVTSTWATELDNHMNTDPTDQQRDVLRMLKNGMQYATHEGGWSAHEQRQFAEGLVEAATVDPEDTVRGRISYNPSGALNYLLYDGRFGDAFIETMAEELDQYERQDNDGVSGLWGNRPDNGVDFGLYMEYGTAAYSLSNHDPMTGLMSAMSHNPQVALDFFSDNDGEPSRSHYYINQRNWNGDGYNGVVAALNAATTDESILEGSDEDRQNAAVLASRTVEYLTERDNAGDLAEKFAWNPHLGVSEDLANILSTYMPGVDRGLDNTEDVTAGAGRQYFDAFNAHMDHVPTFDRDSLSSFMLMATATDEGLGELTHGINQWRGQNLGALADGMHDNPEDNAAALRDGIQDDARLQGFLLNAMGDDSIHDAAEQDARTAATIDMFSDVVDLVPVPGASKIAEGVGQNVFNYVVDEGKGAGFDALREHLTDNEEREVASYNNQAEETLNRQRFTVAQLLYSHGLGGDPDALSPVTRDGDGVLSYAEYRDLPDADRDLIESELFSSNLGVGQYLNEHDYAEAYHRMFNEYFEAGDGD